MKIFGVLIAAVGVLVLVYGGIHYDRQKTIMDIGPIKATATEQHNVPVSPILGGLAVLGGALLVLMPRKKVAA